MTADAKRERRRLDTRRCRERQRKCQKLSKVTYDGAVIDLLIDLGYITAAEASDDRLVHQAISEALRDAARNPKTFVTGLRCPHCGAVLST